MRNGRRTKTTIISPPTLSPAIPFQQHQFREKVELISGDPPMIYIPRDVYSHMFHIVDIAQLEVGWLGTVERTNRGNFIINEIFLLEQEVGSQHTSLSEKGVAELCELLLARKGGIEEVNSLLFWGHSHVNMMTSPSYQDDAQMEEFRRNGAPWFIRGILNRRGTMEFTIYLWQVGVKVVDAAWVVYDQADYRVRAEIEKEFQKKVKKSSPPKSNKRRDKESSESSSRLVAMGASFGIASDNTEDDNAD